MDRDNPNGDSGNILLPLMLTTGPKAAELDGKDGNFDLQLTPELVKIFKAWKEIWDLLISKAKDDNLGKQVRWRL